MSRRVRSARTRGWRTRAWLWAVAAALALGAPGCDCGGGGGPDGGDGGELGQLCQRFAAAECDFAVRCGQGFAGLFGPFAALNQQRANGVVAASERARCEAFVASEPACRQLVASLEAGRSQYNAARFDACLSDLFPRDTCARDLNRASAECLGFAFAAAATPAGGLCAADAECAGGYCDGAGDDAGVELCGTCRQQKSAGPCTRAVECDPAGAYCTPLGDGGTCQPRKGLAEQCDLTRLDECGPGLVCAWSGAPGLSLPRCAIARQEGQGCTVNKLECLRTQLPPELVCAREEDAGTASCVKTFAPPGGRCGVGDDLTAAGLPAAPVCPETEYCDAAAQRCAPRKADGAPCGSNAECAAGTRCLGAPGACAAYADTGGSCGVDSDCRNLLTCRGTGGLCATQWLLAGESSCSTSRPTATATRPCAEGYCDSSGTGLPTCRPLKADGESCDGPEECRSNSCDGTCVAACWR